MPASVETVSLSFANGEAKFTAVTEGKEKNIRIAMNGSRAENDLGGIAGTALCSGVWEQEDTFRITLRMVETCNERVLTVTFKDDKAVITDLTNHAFMREPSVTKFSRI